jgi:uncharacterized protein (TIGR04255 family)
VHLSSEVYPNQPLIEVVFEIRFPGEPAVECQRDRFFSLIRDRYPKVFVPKLKAGQAPSLSPYHFRQQDEQASILTAINRVAYTTKRYPGFAEFKVEALRVTRLFAETFNLNRLHRIGLRYVNAIPFVREAGYIPINNFLKMGISLPLPVTDQLSSLSLSAVSGVSGGSMTTRVEHVVPEDKSNEALLLDFDFAKDAESGDESTLRVDMLADYLEESHKHTKKMFESIITDDYRKFMRGEAI